jgi:hypothetical protein
MSSEPERYARQSHECSVVCFGLVVAGRHPPRLLQPQERPLDHVAPFIQSVVEPARAAAPSPLLEILHHCPLNRQPHSNAGQNVLVGELDDQVGGLLRSVSLTPETADKVIRRAREIVAETHGEVNTNRRELLAQRGVLENRRERLETMYLDGAATEDTYRRQSGQISESLDRIGLEIARLELGRDGNIKVFEQMMRLAVNAGAAYNAAPMPLKRTYLKLFFEEIVVQDRKIVTARLTLAFESLLNNHPVYSEGLPEGSQGEDEHTQKRTPSLIGSGATLEAVINSEGWLPSPSEFITFLKDVSYWGGGRRLIPALSA